MVHGCDVIGDCTVCRNELVCETPTRCKTQKSGKVVAKYIKSRISYISPYSSLFKKIGIKHWMGLKEIVVQNFQVENKMVDRQKIFTPSHRLILIIGLVNS